eukprot:1717529-Amphidinium_carterae.1
MCTSERSTTKRKRWEVSRWHPPDWLKALAEQATMPPTKASPHNLDAQSIDKLEGGQTARRAARLSNLWDL